MANDLYPAFVKVEYASAYGPHVMILPTREWTPDAGSNPSGTYDRWSDDNEVDAEDMIVALLNAMRPWYPGTTSFQRYTIFTKATPTSDPQPRYSDTLSIAGTDAAPGWSQATQGTITARTTAFNLAKLVFLDYGTDDVYNKVTTFPGSGRLNEVVTEWSSDTVAWCGRDGNKIDQFVSFTQTLNEQLRRRYYLA